MPNSILRKLFSPFKSRIAPQEAQAEAIPQQRLTKNIIPADITSGDSLLLWAAKAEVSLSRKKTLDEFDIYDIYRTPCIEKSKEAETYIKIQDFYALLAKAEANKDHFSILCVPNSHGIVAKANTNTTLSISESVDQFSTKDLLDLTWFFSKGSQPIKIGSTQARISICSSAESYKQLIDILASLMHPDHELNKFILEAKILGPSMRYHSAETAILYLDHEKLNEEALCKFQQILKPLDDDNSKGIPFGMHPLTSFVGYGEQNYEDLTNGDSFGSSRTKIIYSAIGNRVKNPERSLAKTLKEECSRKGLDPLHPAFCDGNYGKFNIEYI
jgi:hypothetical protein